MLNHLTPLNKPWLQPASLYGLSLFFLTFALGGAHNTILQLWLLVVMFCCLRFTALKLTGGGSWLCATFFLLSILQSLPDLSSYFFHTYLWQASLQPPLLPQHQRLFTWSQEPFESGKAGLQALACWLLIGFFKHKKNKSGHYQKQQDLLCHLSLMTAWPMLLLCLSQLLLHWHRPYGLWGPYRSEVLLTGPFINPNHFGAYCLWITGLCLYRLQNHRLSPSSQKSFFSLHLHDSFLWICMSLFLWGSASRGSIFCWLCLTLAALPSLFSTRYTLWSIGKALLFVGSLAFAMLWLLPADLQKIVIHKIQTLQHLQTDGKVQIWLNSWPMLKDYVWQGIGTGAFASIYPQYATASLSKTVQYAENIVLQTCLDHGLPLGLAVLGLWFFCLATAYRRSLGKAQLLLCHTLTALWLQQCFDFSLQLPALALPYWALLDSLTDPLLKTKGRKTAWWNRLFLSMALPKKIHLLVYQTYQLLLKSHHLLSIPLVLLVLGWMLCQEASLEKDDKRLQNILNNSNHLSQTEEATIQQLLQRHPKDFVLSLRLAHFYNEQALKSSTKQQRSLQQQALLWLQQSIQQAPSYPQSYLLLGEIFWQQQQQATALAAFHKACHLQPMMTTAVLQKLEGYSETLPEALLWYFLDWDEPDISLPTLQYAYQHQQWQLLLDYQQIQQAQKSQISEAIAHLLLQTQLQQGQYSQVISESYEQLQHRPNDPKLYQHLIRAHITLAPESAKTFVLLSEQLSQHGSDIYLFYIHELLQHQLYQQAINDSEQLQYLCLSPQHRHQMQHLLNIALQGRMAEKHRSVTSLNAANQKPLP